MAGSVDKGTADNVLDCSTSITYFVCLVVFGTLLSTQHVDFAHAPVHGLSHWQDWIRTINMTQRPLRIRDNPPFSFLQMRMRMSYVRASH